MKGTREFFSSNALNLTLVEEAKKYILYALKCTTYLFYTILVMSHCSLDYAYIFKDNFGCKQYQMFYFYVSIHNSLFR